MLKCPPCVPDSPQAGNSLYCLEDWSTPALPYSLKAHSPSAGHAEQLVPLQGSGFSPNPVTFPGASIMGFRVSDHQEFHLLLSLRLTQAHPPGTEDQ